MCVRPLTRVTPAPSSLVGARNTLSSWSVPLAIRRSPAIQTSVARGSTSSRSWGAMIAAKRWPSVSDSRRVRIDCRARGSKNAVGSSRTSTSGCWATARAMATRCRSPSESCPIGRSAKRGWYWSVGGGGSRQRGSMREGVDRRVGWLARPTARLLPRVSGGSGWSTRGSPGAEKDAQNHRRADQCCDGVDRQYALVSRPLRYEFAPERHGRANEHRCGQ